MTVVSRLLSPKPIAWLNDYVNAGGGTGLRAAAALGVDGVLDELDASGLRGRGGSGFPTGRKWRTVLANHSSELPSSIVVNAAEGEPGTFKDRTILRRNPYQVLEGALIAARALNADEVIVATKRTFRREIARLRRAAGEIRRAGWAEGITIHIFEGPSEYLYGEETALLETIDGRYPFPRIAPPYRRGVREIVTTEEAIDSGSGLAARVSMAGPSEELAAPPALVNNVETIAHVAQILSRGATWFREVGTSASPGTVVCTVTGSTRRHGVDEFAMGTPLRYVIQHISGGALPGRRLTAVLPGVANALIPAEHFDIPITHEDFAAIGSGVGSAGFIVLDDYDDPVAVAAGVSRFLAIESCGQCTPCKLGGLHIAELLANLARSDTTNRDLNSLLRYSEGVNEGARCSLATQQQTLVRSLFERFPDVVDAHLERRARGIAPALIAELQDIAYGSALIDAHHRDKHPDWTFGPSFSGKTPAARFVEHREPGQPEREAS